MTITGSMKYIRTLALFAGLAAISTSLFAQSPEGSFRSHQSGNWSDVSSWERSDGSTWVTPAPNVPTSLDGAILIQNGHTVTLDVDTTVDQLTVDTNAILVVGLSRILTVADGADSIDLAVYGTLNNFGSVNPAGRISFENGSTYVHSVPSGGSSLPSSTWRTGSTCRIDSSTGTTPTNLNTQSLYNLVWNATTQTANGGPNFADGTVIYGSVTVLSSNALQWRLTNLSGGQTKNINIRGNLTVNGSRALLSATGSGADTSAKAIITIDGNVAVLAGQWSLINSSAAYAEWRVKGDVNVTGGTLQSGASGWYGRRTLNFAGGTDQSFAVSSPGTIGSASTTFKVSNNSTVHINFPFTLAANCALNLESGKFVTTATNILTLPSTAMVLGGNSSAYVDGPLTQTIASANPTVKMFPIGNGSVYRPLTLSVNQDAATATTYTAQIVSGAPPARNLPLALTSVSSVRYYTVTKGTGANLSPTLGATIQLNYGPDDQAYSASVLRIAKDDGAGNWLNIGGSGTADTTGSITSNAFYSFSDFVLATADTTQAAAIPTVVTTAMSYISTTFATSGGNITNDGGAAVSARGVCWNLTGSPTLLDPRTSDGTGSGIFTSSVTGLVPGSTYHLRAYATNSAGTGYGDEMVFTALSSVVPPTVTTTAVSSIQVTTAVSGGNVTLWGGDSVTTRGVCWNLTGSPTTADHHTIDGAGLGSFASGLSPLTGNTTYYLRAYAVNSSGTGYGGELSFTTQIAAPDTTVVVAQDGSGNYTTVQAAFNAVPNGYTGKWKIFVKKGVYYEKCTLSSGKINVVLQGENRDSTIITYDDYADRYGSGNPGTSGSFSVAIDASDFVAKDITIQNTYAPQQGVTGTQAVALRTQGDRHEYINCRILGFQDTYYSWGGSGTGRMYHKGCYIEGTVDFIFGRNIAVFDSCTIHEKRNSSTLTAASTDASSLFGYVFRNCTLVFDSLGYDGVPVTSVYLGRPWQGSPRTVFLNTFEPSALNPAGWQAWNVTPALYGEFNCYGPGSATGGRVGWSSQLGGPAASGYSLSNIFAHTAASSPLILYDWIPPDAAPDAPLIMRIVSSADPHGSISPLGIVNVSYGGSQTFSITPAPGYHIGDVLVDGSSVGPLTSRSFSGITDNHTISATFVQNPPPEYSLTVNATNRAVVKVPDSTSYAEGTVVRLTAVPNTGYHFAGWTGDLTGSVNPDSILMNGNKIVTANFAINQYVIDASADTGGSITPEGQITLNHGESQDFLITPATGYHVDSVVVDGLRTDSLTSYTFVNVTSGHTIRAFFSVNVYTLTLDVPQGGGTIMKDPDQPGYLHGMSVRLTAEALDLSWKFSAWGGDTSTSLNPLTVVMERDRSITALFIRDSAYLASYRTFSHRAIAFDVDNKQKVNKFVPLKNDKDEFELILTEYASDVTGLHAEFGSAIDTSFPMTTLPPSTHATADPKLKKWDFTFLTPITTGEPVHIFGRAWTAKTVKLTGYWWTRTGTQVSGKRSKYIVAGSILRLPMPNRVNALAAMLNPKSPVGFGPTGLVVGRNKKVPLDSSKYYGWLQMMKYGDVLKTLSTRGAGQPASDAAHPFDFFTETGKVLKGKQTSLPIAKEKNSLMANMIALKVNIMASDIGINPPGLGDLIYQGGDAFRGLTLRDIAHVGDSVMMGWLKDSLDSHSRQIKVHMFDYAFDFRALDSIIALIDSAFEGPLDTTDGGFSKGLSFKGTRPLVNVTFLRANPASVQPEQLKIVPSHIFDLPESYQLYQNYPNPFNPVTMIQFDLPEPSDVTLKIFNVLGQEVGKVFDHIPFDQGHQQMPFNGSGLASGVYFYRLVAEPLSNDPGHAGAQIFSKTLKMLLIK